VKEEEEDNNIRIIRIRRMRIIIMILTVKQGGGIGEEDSDKEQALEHARLCLEDQEADNEALEKEEERLAPCATCGEERGGKASRGMERQRHSHRDTGKGTYADTPGHTQTCIQREKDKPEREAVGVVVRHGVDQGKHLHMVREAYLAQSTRKKDCQCLHINLRIERL
jgi:hypothetical protein